MQDSKVDKRKIAIFAAIFLLVSFFLQGLVFGQTRISDSKFKLTAEEKAFLAKHPRIRIGIMSNWPPMNFVDESGQPQGIGVDFIKALNKRLGGVLVIEPAPFKENFDKVKKKQLDALMDITPKPEREPFFEFTRPYITIPHVLVGRRDGPYFSMEKSLNRRTVALEKGYYNVVYFRRNYPRVNIKEYDSTSDALDAVARGEADAYAGNRAVAIYLMERELIGNLQLQGRMRKPSVELTIGVRKDWPQFMNILDKGLASITEGERNAIFQKWASGREEGEFNYELLARVLGVMVVIIIFIVIWNRQLAAEVARRVRKERELQEYLQLQVERMPIGLIVWDKEFRVKTWNPAAAKIFGFTEKEAMGRHPYDIIVPKEAQLHVDEIWSRLLQGDETAQSVNDNITKDGRTITCSWANTPLKKADGEVIGVLSMVQDVTDKKNLRA